MIHNLKCFSLSIFVISSLLSFSTNSHAQQSEELDTSTIDSSVRIQDDLFKHVNGTWLKNAKIPDDKSNYGSFGILADQSQYQIRKIVEKTAEVMHPNGTNEQKIADFYRSFMNEKLTDELGFAPLTAELAKIDAIESKADVWKSFGYLGTIGVGTPVGFFVSQDPGQATQYICQLIQSGTSLPDRDYYFKQDDASAKARRALLEHVQKHLENAEVEDSYLGAEEIVALETKLAEISWERVKLRDPKKRYNKMTFEELSSLTGGKLDWAAYFKASLISQNPDQINVNTPSFFESLAVLVEDTSVDTWKRYLKFQLVDGYAQYLSKPFVEANFDFYETQLAGVPEQRPRWKRAVNAISGQGGGDFGALGEAVGQVYVKEHFRPDAKEAMQTLVDNLLTAFGQSIDDLTWMTDETKVKAREKLSKIGTKIGYPDVWRDYSKLDVRADDLFGNVMRSNLVEHNRNIGHLGKEIDRTEWGMTPQTVNAYYNPSKNEIVFPAAILQPPFFGKTTPEALNYGGIGAVIGHEISHAFDDQGSQYDGDGNLKNWWTEEDRKAFKELTVRLVAQYAEYEPLPNSKVDGELTLGENIADLSGLSIAYKAMSIARAGKPEEKVAGWNSDQLFFVGWSRVWQRKYREKEMIRRLLTDSHSPSEYRANGPVTNIEAFYKAFDIQQGDRLYKPEADRIKIW